MRYYYYLAWGCVLFTMAFAKPVTAFEHLQDPLHRNATCETACHLPENIEQARADKTQKAECTSCHQGGLPLKTLTPFKTPDPFLFIESQQPNPPFAVATASGACRTNHGFFQNPNIQQKTENTRNGFYRCR